MNISSVTGLRSFPGVLAYCVSKAGVDQLTRCAALELAPKGVRVNAVNPGVVVTEIHKRGGMSEENYEKFLEHSRTTHPIGRVGNAGGNCRIGFLFSFRQSRVDHRRHLPDRWGPSVNLRPLDQNPKECLLAGLAGLRFSETFI